MRGRDSLDRHDPLEARFRSAINKRDRNKTGMRPTDQYYHICEKCSQVHRSEDKDPPLSCKGEDAITGVKCTSVRFKSYNDIEIEAAPIGILNIDLRSPAQKGRKGKVR